MTGKNFELFDIKNDPRSQKNLNSSAPSQEERMLAKALSDWHASLPLAADSEAAMSDEEMNILDGNGYLAGKK